MKYEIIIDLEPGEPPQWWAVCQEKTCEAAEIKRRSLSSGQGFDLTQAVLRAGNVILRDARERVELWGVVK